MDDEEKRRLGKLRNYGDTRVEYGSDEFGKILIEYTTPKRKEPIYLSKGQDGFAFYEVRVSPSVPKQLSGRFLSENEAHKKILRYIDTLKMTKATERDLKTARREAQKASQEE